MNHSHFDSLHDYDAEIPEHMRVHYLEKKTSITEKWIHRFIRSEAQSILDVGCGTGWHLAKLAAPNRSLVGLDSSTRQLSKLMMHSSPIEGILGSAEQLPFEDQSFEVVLSINTIHHLPTLSAQHQALREIHRVLKKGGIFIIHEVNIINPVIRFYMDKIFPKIRKIDTGEEIWLQMSTLSSILGDPMDRKYYTFAPDWTPSFLLKSIKLLEHGIEKTPLAILGAHFAAVFLKPLS
jgi:SAM-dependent methyltransferase